MIVTAYSRLDATLATLGRLRDCVPPPDEVIVHVDDNQVDCANSVAAAFPGVRVIVSPTRVGPGGGRNRMIAAASHDLVASFDDDSFPVDSDYFSRVRELFAVLPDAAAIGATITDKGNPIVDARPVAGMAVHFGGGGVIYRKRDFLDSGGYVPLAVAYGMEEVDLCLRYHDQGKRIYHSPWLRVFHDNDLSGHASADVTAASISNLALLVYLRYPLRYWLHGMLQVGNRVAWLLKVGRVAGIVEGLFRVPVHVFRHRALRAPVRSQTVGSFLRARRNAPNLVAVQIRRP